MMAASIAVGALASSAAPPPLIRKFGLRRVMIAGFGATAVVMAGAGWVTSGIVLAGFIALAGFMDAIVDVAQNVTGVRVENSLGKSVLSSMHACWSLGAAAAGAVATWAASSGVPIQAHLAISSAVSLGVGLAGVWLVGHYALGSDTHDTSDAPPPPGTTPQRRTRVFWLVLPLVILAISGAVIEDVANNWASMAGVYLAGVRVDAAGVFFTLMVGAQAVGRFTGDAMINRLGRVRVARIGGTLITVGAIIAVVSTAPVPLIIGLVAMGFGCATIVPSAYAVAAALPGVSSSTGVTIVSWLLRVGFLATSPLIGALTGLTSLRVGLTVPVIAGVAVILLAPRLRVSVTSATEPKSRQPRQ
jgi:hypothetical protein